MRTHALHIILALAGLDLAWHAFHVGEIARRWAEQPMRPKRIPFLARPTEAL